MDLWKRAFLFGGLSEAISLCRGRTLQGLYCCIFGENLLWKRRVLGGLQYLRFHVHVQLSPLIGNSEEGLPPYGVPVTLRWG